LYKDIYSNAPTVTEHRLQLTALLSNFSCAEHFIQLGLPLGKPQDFFDLPNSNSPANSKHGITNTNIVQERVQSFSWLRKDAMYGYTDQENSRDTDYLGSFQLSINTINFFFYPAFH
tara:strand:+ start:2379 stop:2729 length:351 start_codon:yes stop_codon:yes gene_type:complete